MDRRKAAGINGRGVIAPGANLTWEITDEIATGTTAVCLVSPVASSSGGKLYGVELDLEASYAPLSYLKLSLEYDLLLARDFFPRQEVIHKLLLGADLIYEL